MDTQEIGDRLEIIALLARYTHAIDTGQWDLLDEVFCQDAVIDYSSSGGIRGSRDEVKGWLAQVLAHWPARLHLVGAAHIDFLDGTQARVSAPFTDTLAPTREMVAARTEGFLHGGGWYHHLMLRTPDGWRSTELVEEQSWRTAR
ncbi:nuclear transport factor 2 family protein [Nonomuraea sp. NPDC049709]|uniref:nuclear transport factor 2 family protein n=1 Tax=Nonomuraea sp. NPDC049709 TaxID=3154736 RepID=UPI0034325D8B